MPPKIGPHSGMRIFNYSRSTGKARTKVLQNFCKAWVWANSASVLQKPLTMLRTYSCALFVCTEARGDRDAGKRKDRDYKETERDSKRRARDDEQVSNRSKDRDTRDGRGRSKDRDRKHRSGDADRERHSSQGPDPRSGDKHSQRKDASSGRYMILTYAPIQHCIKALLEPTLWLKGFCERSPLVPSNKAFAQADATDPFRRLGPGHCSDMNTLSEYIQDAWDLDCVSCPSVMQLLNMRAPAFILVSFRDFVRLKRVLSPASVVERVGILSSPCPLFRQGLLSSQILVLIACIAAYCLAGMLLSWPCHRIAQGRRISAEWELATF